MTEGTTHNSLQALSLVLLLGLLHHCAVYCNCPAVETEPQVLVMLGKWVVLVAIVECPVLAVLVAAMLVAPTPIEWIHVAQVAKQVLMQW